MFQDPALGPQLVVDLWCGVSLHAIVGEESKVLTLRVGRCSPDFWKTILGEERMHEHFVRRPPGCSPHHVGGGRVEVVPVIVDPVLRRESIVGF